MIVSIRSALLCESVEQTPTGTNYTGVHGGTVAAKARPGFISGWLALMVDFDGDATRGQIKLTATDFNFSAPFAVPAGQSTAAMAFPILVPLEREGALTVSVSDDARASKTHQAKWRMEFSQTAVALDRAEWQKLAKQAAEGNATLFASLAAQGRPTP